MRHSLVIALILASFLVATPYPKTANAYIGRPIGGKLAAVVPGVACASESLTPQIFIPASPAITSAPIIINPAAMRFRNYSATTSSWVLGFALPDSVSCYTTSTPPVPVLTSSLIFFGSSLPGAR